MSTQTAAMNLDVLAILSRDRVRLIRPDETIPESMNAGFEKYGKLDRDWCWVYESGAEIKGVLLASPCHGLAFVWRFKVNPECGEGAALKMLKRFMGDCKKRGVNGYLTLLDLATPTGAKLARVVKRCGGNEFGPMTLLSSPFPKGARCLR